MTIEELEAERVRVMGLIAANSKKARPFMIGVLVGFGCLAIGAITVNFLLIIIGMIAIIRFAFLVVKRSKEMDPIRKSYEAMFKENVVKASLSEVMTVLAYHPAEHFGEELLERTKLFDSFDRCFGNDLLEAEYKGYHFEQCELHLEEEYTETDEQGRKVTRYRTIFKGRLMIIDYDTFSNEPLYLYDRGRRLSEKELLKEVDSTKDVVHTESLEFNSRFKAVSKVPGEALRILTPHMMEAILAANDRLKVKVQFAFFDDKLYFAWGNLKDTMEVSVSSKTTIAEQKARIQDEVKAVTDFLDTFPLKTLKAT
jgi:hypothetical protein